MTLSPGKLARFFFCCPHAQMLSFYSPPLLPPRIHHEKLISLYWSSQAGGEVKNKQLTCIHLYQGKNPIISGLSVSKIM